MVRWKTFLEDSFSFIFDSLLELNTPKPASDESEKKVTLKTSDNIKNVKAPNNYAGTGKSQGIFEWLFILI